MVLHRFSDSFLSEFTSEAHTYVKVGITQLWKTLILVGDAHFALKKLASLGQKAILTPYH